MVFYGELYFEVAQLFEALGLLRWCYRIDSHLSRNRCRSTPLRVFVLDTVRLFGIQKFGLVVQSVEVSVVELADRLNLSREVASRALDG